MIGSRLLLVQFRRFSGTFETSLRIMAKAMRAAKAMKAMKRVSKFAKGKMAKSAVFRGEKTATVGGLTKSNLMKNKNGKIVSKKMSANGKRKFRYIAPWVRSVKRARKALNLKGFVAVNGKNAQGKALYAKAKSFYSK